MKGIEMNGNDTAKTYDVIIVGAGAVGCAAARELSRYELSVAVLEKNSDVAGETTGRNSAVVHAGFNNAPGSMMASLCVEGNEGFGELCEELDVPFRETGKLVVGFDEEDREGLEHLLEQGRANGCKGLKILEEEALQTLLREHRAPFRMALWSPHTGITNPFLYCVALAENALANGVEFYLNTEVTGIRTEVTEATETMDEKEPAGTRFVIETAGAPKAAGAAGAPETVGTEFRCRYLINCAGLQADRIAAMAGADRYRIYPCRGEYFVLDKQELAMPVYPVPRKGAGGLGVHLTPTIEGNVLIGPSAEYLDDGPDAGIADGPDDGDAGQAAPGGAREDYACTREVMDELMRQAGQLLGLEGNGKDAGRDARDAVRARLRPIGNYSGVRPKLTPPGEGGYHDFVIRAEEDVPGLIDLVGIESPGLTASVPIARRICRIIGEMEAGGCAEGTEDEGAGRVRGLKEREEFCGKRRGILRFREQTPEEQAKLIAADPDYGEIICRCQKITKREIREAIENPLGARSVSAIKYRAWATTGRCNGGYCLPRIAQMLAEEYGVDPEEIRYRDPGSELFTGRVK